MKTRKLTAMPIQGNLAHRLWGQIHDRKVGWPTKNKLIDIDAAVAVLRTLVFEEIRYNLEA